MKVKTCVSLFVLLFLVGCMASTPFKPENAERIQNIYFNSVVSRAEKAFYNGPPTPGVFFGVVGAIVEEMATSASSAPDEGTLIAVYMTENNIDIGHIALQEFERQIRQNPLFVDKTFVENLDDADAVFELEVPFYGIGQTHGFSSVYRPNLGILAKLRSSDGEILWEKYAFEISHHSDVEAIPFKEYYKAPSIMREKFEQITREVVPKLISDISR